MYDFSDVVRFDLRSTCNHFQTSSSFEKGVAELHDFQTYSSGIAGTSYTNCGHK